MAFKRRLADLGPLPIDTAATAPISPYPHVVRLMLD